MGWLNGYVLIYSVESFFNKILFICMLGILNIDINDWNIFLINVCILIKIGYYMVYRMKWYRFILIYYYMYYRYY